MKKTFNFFMLLAAIMALTVSSARGAIINDYHCDFNNTIDTSNHAFQVASNWGHHVESHSGFYVYYSYESTKGVDNTGALLAGSQTIGYSWGGYTTKAVNDMIVTPPFREPSVLKSKNSTQHTRATAASSSLPLTRMAHMMPMLHCVSSHPPIYPQTTAM